jgi:hypothetical protein
MNDENNNTPPQNNDIPQAPQGDLSVDQITEKTKNTLGKLENISGWSWGGFMFAPVYMVATKNYLYLLLYLLMIIPIINIFVQLGISIYMGLKAHNMVAGSVMFRSDDERNGFNRAMDHAGFIFFCLFVVLFVLGFLFMGALFSAIMGMGGGDAMMYPGY